MPVAFAGAPGVPLTVTGAGEGPLGVDLALSAGYRSDSGLDLFAAYDGKFRDGLTAHAGTVGFKLR